MIDTQLIKNTNIVKFYYNDLNQKSFNILVRLIESELYSIYDKVIKVNKNDFLEYIYLAYEDDKEVINDINHIDNNHNTLNMIVEDYIKSLSL